MLHKLIVMKHKSKVIEIDPPILSRVFQELSNGMIDSCNAKRISRYPFPFPYAQMISMMLLCHFAATMFVGAVCLSDVGTSFFYAFCSTTSVWSINYIAIEIEGPFGLDANDLPLQSMQKSMNDALVTLLKPKTQRPPEYSEFGAAQLVLGTKAW